MTRDAWLWLLVKQPQTECKLYISDSWLAIIISTEPAETFACCLQNLGTTDTTAWYIANGGLSNDDTIESLALQTGIGMNNSMTAAIDE